MKVENKDKCAFPAAIEECGKEFDGLTKLEHFAGLAMQGYLAMCQGRDQPSESEVACESLMYAKELLKHLEAEANE